LSVFLKKTVLFGFLVKMGQTMTDSISDDLLANKTILITGAGDGIGKALAIQCASLGAEVILLGRTVSKLEAVYDQIASLNKQSAAILPVDLNGATEEHYRDLASTVLREYGKLDGLVHNASQLGVLSPFTQIESKMWDEVMQTNVTSAFLMTKYLIPVLEKAPHASTIFTSSGVGNKGRAYWGPYSISKFATEGMMQVLADEYENSTLRFNVINPGATRTAMRASAFPAEDTAQLKTPEQMLSTYLHLLSDESIAVTGTRHNAQ